MEIARELRETGINVDIGLQPKRGVGDQLKYADRRGIPIAIIAGSAEIARGSVAIKELKSGEQRDFLITELATGVSEMLAQVESSAS
jgi:histidyl-tRNA synthetase